MKHLVCMNLEGFELFLDVTGMEFVAMTDDVYTFRTVLGTFHQYAVDFTNEIICHLPNLGV